ncbi:MAG: DUF4911 domain-containing protein [Syntrophomonadaceae bacterium]|jgi:hypothetical protein|nr:DUF4911 domain-containing protein [Syntrophomonadaceae bacterium]
MHEDEENIFLRLEPRDIDVVNKIMEGYDGLGIVSTLNCHEGLIVIRVTPDTREDVLGIVQSFPVKFEFV